MAISRKILVGFTQFLFFWNLREILFRKWTGFRALRRDAAKLFNILDAFFHHPIKIGHFNGPYLEKYWSYLRNFCFTGIYRKFSFVNEQCVRALRRDAAKLFKILDDFFHHPIKFGQRFDRWRAPACVFGYEKYLRIIPDKFVVQQNKPHQNRFSRFGGDVLTDRQTNRETADSIW